MINHTGSKTVAIALSVTFLIASISGGMVTYASFTDSGNVEVTFTTGNVTAGEGFENASGASESDSDREIARDVNDSAGGDTDQDHKDSAEVEEVPEEEEIPPDEEKEEKGEPTGNESDEDESDEGDSREDESDEEDSDEDDPDEDEPAEDESGE